MDYSSIWPQHFGAQKKIERVQHFFSSGLKDTARSHDYGIIVEHFELSSAHSRRVYSTVKLMYEIVNGYISALNSACCSCLGNVFMV